MSDHYTEPMARLAPYFVGRLHWGQLGIPQGGDKRIYPFERMAAPVSRPNTCKLGNICRVCPHSQRRRTSNIHPPTQWTRERGDGPYAGNMDKPYWFETRTAL